MAPTKKNNKKSSKATGSIPVKKAPVKPPSKPKKSEAAAAASSPRGPTTVYVLASSEGYMSDGFHSSSSMTTKVLGVYYNEDQAYAAGIRHLIQEFEYIAGELPRLREIAKTRTMSLKKRMAKLVEDGNGPDSEQLVLGVQKSEVIPSQIVDEEKLLDNLKKHSSSDGDEDEDDEEKEEEDHFPF